MSQRMIPQCQNPDTGPGKPVWARKLVFSTEKSHFGTFDIDVTRISRRTWLNICHKCTKESFCNVKKVYRVSENKVMVKKPLLCPFSDTDRVKKWTQISGIYIEYIYCLENTKMSWDGKICSWDQLWVYVLGRSRGKSLLTTWGVEYQWFESKKVQNWSGMVIDTFNSKDVTWEWEGWLIQKMCHEKGDMQIFHRTTM